MIFNDLGGLHLILGYMRDEFRVVESLLFTALQKPAILCLFSNDNPLVRLGRDLGLGLVNRLPALRRTLIAEAAGVSGTLPQLLRGKAL